MPNGSFWRVFKKPEACGQTVLPDRSVLIGQKLVENAQIKKNSNATFWGIFKHCAKLVLENPQKNIVYANNDQNCTCEF